MESRPFKARSGTRNQSRKASPTSPVKPMSRFRDREKSKKKMDPSFVDPSEALSEAKLETKSEEPKSVLVMEYIKKLKGSKVIPKELKLKSTPVKSPSSPDRKRPDIKSKYLLIFKIFIIYSD